MKLILLSIVLLILTPNILVAEEQLKKNKDIKVKISHFLEQIVVTHNGKKVTIKRNQNTKNLINPDFAYTSRRCPPFCIQPIKLAPGVETIGTREMINYLKMKEGGDDSILIIDSRGPSWIKKGTIPGSINIRYKKLSLKSANEDDMAEILEETFGAKRTAEFWDFSEAKTLVLFCNGMWCGQAPTNIKSLLKIGYPANKLKWYRGGMQEWEILGLTTISP